MKKVANFKRFVVIALLLSIPLGVFAQASCTITTVYFPGGEFKSSSCSNPASNTSWWIFY
ncbi:hypothetical protein EGI22_01845 [Lacihabitans sp. LS3-19]|uniref:hypothetical protein n=1 Tax=Lacihabitans sp. LS3-19 TaxID=2487335 RepID=UPI0020CFA8FD|nr:hypothetical protein [Lacihabitans sp. LS3-19]MCP9766632.1 hypothetical protein [Lacihabitans sp. LS3-19]